METINVTQLILLPSKTYTHHSVSKRKPVAFSPCVSDSKESACDSGDPSSIPGLGRSPGEEKGYPLHYSGLENSMDCIVFLTPCTLSDSVDCSLARLLCPRGFSRQEYGSGLPFPPSGDLPDPGIKPRSPASPALAGRFFYHLANPKYSSCVCESPSVMSLCDPKDCSPPGSSIHGNFPGKNTGVGCHALLQEIFPTQGPESRSPTLQVDSLPFEPPGTLIKKNCKLSSFDSCLSDILSIADFQAQPTTV